MAIIKWEPFNDLDRFFGDFPSMNLPKISFDLAVDLYEEKGNVVAKMNLPGIDPEKIDVRVEGGYLHVSGSREEEKEEKDKHYYRQEIRRGSFERAVRLPEGVQRDNVTAEYESGVLKVTLPKKAGGEKEGKVTVTVKK